MRRRNPFTVSRLSIGNGGCSRLTAIRGNVGVAISDADLIEEDSRRTKERGIEASPHFRWH